MNNSVMTYVKKANEKGINVNITFESDGITVVKLYTKDRQIVGRCGTSFGKVSKLVNELTNKFSDRSYSPAVDLSQPINNPDLDEETLKALGG